MKRSAAFALPSFLALAVLAGCAGSDTRKDNSGELKTASDQTAIEKRASIRLQLAVSYYQEGKYEVALDEIKQALAADPNFADAYGVRALIYTGMGELALADENYKHALRLEPNNPELSNNYGSFLCQSMNRPADALRYLDAAIANRTYQRPLNAMVNAGVCSIKNRNFDAAERYLLDALRLSPDQPAVNASLARVYYERRNMQRAGFFINRLIETAKLDMLPADTLWLAMRVQRKLGDRTHEAQLAAQLRRRFPGSPEYAAFERGAFDE